MVQFTAEACAFTCDESIDIHALVLAEFPDGSGSHFSIQRAVNFHAQDRDLGHDTYCLVDDYGTCCYGGVISWHIDEGPVLHIRLDEYAASVFESTQVEIALTATGPEIVREAMSVLLS